MTHNKVDYWKKRAREKLKSSFKQIYANIEEVEGIADHAGLEKKGISKAVEEVIKAYEKLDKAFSEAKVRKND